MPDSWCSIPKAQTGIRIFGTYSTSPALLELTIVPRRRLTICLRLCQAGSAACCRSRGRLFRNMLDLTRRSHPSRVWYCAQTPRRTSRCDVKFSQLIDSKHTAQCSFLPTPAHSDHKILVQDGTSPTILAFLSFILLPRSLTVRGRAEYHVPICNRFLFSENFAPLRSSRIVNCKLPAPSSRLPGPRCCDIGCQVWHWLKSLQL